MRWWLLWLLCWLCLPVYATGQAAVDAEGKPCEPLVDLSESGDFHRLHFECDEAPPVVNTYEPADEPKPEQTRKQAKPGNVAGTEVLLRARVQPNGMTEALASLYSQMAAQCPSGWEKDREWAEQAQGQLYLHARITCR
ncbi:hypothetical protein L1F30_05415 [Simiduia sp. 21SJ11W-1]|uniref:hypothetical protein n=1 Tax=Simiduia sp. 21SJ11W-1 TaxID=2909669 RepID=UPI0020A0DE02|nr:hypothetical protein [Simiduia sp. 21SJ11W-1]UTA48985.1 hypothetical protein L1F30_05415 [Simiduia sp. 21SJ11W-1]